MNDMINSMANVESALHGCFPVSEPFSAMICGDPCVISHADGKEDLEIEFVLTGKDHWDNKDHKGQMVYGYIPIKDPNALIEDLGSFLLSKVRNALGLHSLDDYDDFAGGELVIKLGNVFNEQGEPHTVVCGYEPLSFLQDLADDAVHLTA